MKRLNLILTSLIFLFVFAVIISLSNKNNKLNANVFENINWSEYRTLDWTDFKGEPDYNDNFIKALTASSVKYSYSCNGTYLDYDINAVFKQNESWVKEEARTNYTLSHEQIHFDITELHVRKLKETLNQRIFYCDQVEEFEAVVTEGLKKWRDQQVEYDNETYYSVFEDKQEEWFVKITSELFGPEFKAHIDYANQY